MSQKKKISVVIADDHPVFRAGLKHIIEQDSRMEVVGEAGNGIEAVSIIEKLEPDIAIFDIDMPECNGIQAVKKIKDKKLNIKIIFLTMYSDETFFKDVMELGVTGYVLKDNALNDILNAIKYAVQGKIYITPDISGYLLKRDEKNRFSDSILKNITAMERRILTLIAGNKTTREIADELFISYKTVENHRSNICTKLNLKGSHALLKFAFENKDTLLSKESSSQNSN